MRICKTGVQEVLGFSSLRKCNSKRAYGNFLDYGGFCIFIDLNVTHGGEKRGTNRRKGFMTKMTNISGHLSMTRNGSIHGRTCCLPIFEVLLKYQNELTKILRLSTKKSI